MSRDLLDARKVLRFSAAGRFRLAGLDALASRLEACGTTAGGLRCLNCGRSHPVHRRCNLRWCPECAWRISARRAQYVSAWASTTRQPKHVVLTSRNVRTLEPRRTSDAFVRLRRQRPFQWRNGCRSLETTNEGRGWHVHIHALIDVRWIDPGELSRRWGRLMGQDYAIVCVKDARLDTYLAELAKYAAKPTQVAAWPPDELRQFVEAHEKVRVFSTFGSARGLPQPRLPHLCEHCGGESWEFEPPTLVERIDSACDPWQLATDKED